MIVNCGMHIGFSHKAPVKTAADDNQIDFFLRS